MGCYPRYVMGVNDQVEGFGNASSPLLQDEPPRNDSNTSRNIGGAFKWASSRDLGENTYVGRWGEQVLGRWAGVTFPGSGYAQVLPRGEGDARVILQKLRDADWLDLATRAAFVDLTVYNPNSGLVSLIKLACEFPAGGQAVNFVNLRTARTGMFVPDSSEILVLVPEILLLFMTGGYLLLEGQRAREGGFLGYWTSAWSLIEWSSHLLFLSAWGLRILPFNMVPKSLHPRPWTHRLVTSDTNPYSYIPNPEPQTLNNKPIFIYPQP
jgi:hypothetical protein